MTLYIKQERNVSIVSSLGTYTLRMDQHHNPDLVLTLQIMSYGVYFMEIFSLSSHARMDFTL